MRPGFAGPALNYTGQMRRLFLGAILAGAIAIAAGAGWWLWRQKQNERFLFRRLPGENSLLLYLDMNKLRRSEALLPLVRSQVDPDPDYAAFVRQTGFDYQRDLDEAAVCYLADRVYVLARGRFDEPRLSEYAAAQGGSCAGGGVSGKTRVCWMPASRPDRKISFFILSPGVLALATAPEPDAVLQLEVLPVPSAEPLAQAAAARSKGMALLWATAAPPALDRLLSETGGGVSPNLLLLSRALAAAQRAYLLLMDRSPNLELSLQAVCASEAQAGELRRLLQGLNDLIGGLLRGPASKGPPSDWGRLLASAVIAQNQNTVTATWTLDQSILRNFGPAQGAR